MNETPRRLRMLSASIRILIAGTLALAPATVHASAPHRAALAATQPVAVDPATPAELDSLYAHAQMQVESYNATGDVAKLRVAHEELSRWLVAHGRIYGYADAATTARAPVQKQIAMLEEILGKPAPAPAPAPAVAAAPSPDQAMTADQARRRRQAQHLTGWGIGALSVGAGVLVLGALPAWLLRNNALSNAAEETFYVDEQRYIRRAQRRHYAALALLGTGTALLAAGVAFVTIGAAGRARLRRELAFSPAVGPGFAGASATLRF